MTHPHPIVPHRPSRWKWVLDRPIAILLLLQLMGGIMLSPHRTFFPIYARELGYSALWISAIAAARQAMGLIASPIGGISSDTLGRKWTLLIGQIGFLFSSLVFVTPSTAAISAFWTVGGLGMGLATLGSQSYLLDAAPRDRLGLLTALYNWGYTLGGALSSPVAGWLLDRWGYGALGLALIAFSLATLATNSFALPGPPAHDGHRTASSGALFGYRDVAARPEVIVLVLIRFLPTLYWGMALVLIPLLLDNAGATKTQIAIYATVSQVCASLAQIVVGRAADRLGARAPTIVVCSTLAISIISTGLLPHQLWSVFAFGTLGTSAAWSLSTLLPSQVALVSSAHERGRILGWIHLWWNLGMMAGSMLGGYLFERAAGLPFLVSGTINVLLIALAVFFFRMVAPKAASPVR
jgi:MFS family permease